MAGSMDHEAYYTANDNDGSALYVIGKNQSVCWLSHPLQWKIEQPANLANLLWRMRVWIIISVRIRIDCVKRFERHLLFVTTFLFISHHSPVRRCCYYCTEWANGTKSETTFKNSKLSIVETNVDENDVKCFNNHVVRAKKNARIDTMKNGREISSERQGNKLPIERVQCTCESSCT